jgi:hypothetical protein
MGFVLCAGQLMAGCGEDTPERVSFALPPISIDISSENPQWRSAPATAVPAMVCAGPHTLGNDCCAPPPGVPATGVDCQQYPVACDPSNNLCALTFDVENKTNVDLIRVPQILAVDGRVFARAELTALKTWVDHAETLPVRHAGLFIAPTDAGTTSTPEATLLTTVPLTENAVTTTPDVGAQQAFSGFVRDYRMPFSLWVAAHVVVPSGSAPAGTLTVHAEAQAQAWF